MTEISIVLKLARVAMAAKDVADRSWSTSCSEMEHFERISAMDRLRAELEVLSHGAANISGTDGRCYYVPTIQDGTPASLAQPSLPEQTVGGRW